MEHFTYQQELEIEINKLLQLLNRFWDAKVNSAADHVRYKELIRLIRAKQRIIELLIVAIRSNQSNLAL
jgi:hypothetical protein